MALSPKQKRLVQLLHEGYRLRIVRSILNGLPVYTELLCPRSLCVETVQWWRIERMLRTRTLKLDSGNIAEATHVVAADL